MSYKKISFSFFLFFLIKQFHEIIDLFVDVVHPYLNFEKRPDQEIQDHYLYGSKDHEEVKYDFFHSHVFSPKPLPYSLVLY